MNCIDYLQTQQYGYSVQFFRINIVWFLAKTLYRNLVHDRTLETHEQNFDRLVKIETALIVNMVASKFVICVTNLEGAKNNKIHKCKCMGRHG